MLISNCDSTLRQEHVDDLETDQFEVDGLRQDVFHASRIRALSRNIALRSGWWLHKKTKGVGVEVEVGVGVGVRAGEELLVVINM